MADITQTIEISFEDGQVKELGKILAKSFVDEVRALLGTIQSTVSSVENKENTPEENKEEEDKNKAKESAGILGDAFNLLSKELGAIGKGILRFLVPASVAMLVLMDKQLGEIMKILKDLMMLLVKPIADVITGILAAVMEMLYPLVMALYMMWLPHQLKIMKAAQEVGKGGASAIPGFVGTVAGEVAGFMSEMFGTVLKEATKIMIDISYGLMEALMVFLGGIAKLIITFLLGKEAGKAFSKMMGGMVAIVDATRQKMKLWLDFTFDVAGKVANSLGSLLGNAVEDLGENSDTAYDSVQQLVIGISGLFGEDFKSAVKDGINDANEFIASLKEAMENFKNGKTDVSEFASAVAELELAFDSKEVDKIIDAYTELNNFYLEATGAAAITANLTAALTLANTELEKFKDFINDLVDPLQKLNSIKEGASKVWEAGVQAGKEVVENVQKEGGIEFLGKATAIPGSPESLKFADIIYKAITNEDTRKKLNEGLNEINSAFVQTASDTAESVRKGMVDDKDSTTKEFDKSLELLKKSMKDYKEYVSEQTSEIKKMYSEAEEYRDKYKELYESLKEKEAESKATAVDDALITKTGEVIKLNPNDNILAFQGGLPGGAPVINITINGNANEDIIDEMIRRMTFELRQQTNIGEIYG